MTIWKFRMLIHTNGNISIWGIRWKLRANDGDRKARCNKTKPSTTKIPPLSSLNLLSFLEWSLSIFDSPSTPIFYFNEIIKKYEKVNIAMSIEISISKIKKIVALQSLHISQGRILPKNFLISSAEVIVIDKNVIFQWPENVCQMGHGWNRCSSNIS